MTERGLPTTDGAPACPFVAFEDDREARATSPDHRHRCYAELVPSPRASAHQEAYCLSSAFPVCPTFQDWARREAAHARGEGERPRAALSAQPETAEQAAEPDDDSARADEGARSRRQVPADEPPIRRNPHRDWAAPPPWAPGGAGAAAGGATRRSTSSEPASTPGFLADRTDPGRGLAGSAADRLAVGPSGHTDSGIPAPYDSPAAAAPDEELAGLVARRRPDEPPSGDYLPPSRSTRRPTVSSTRASQRERERENERDAVVGPSWERARRFEAYPTIRARTGFSAPPRLAILAGALVIAAVALFFLPALFGVGSGGPDAATPSPTGSQGTTTSASPEPSVQAAPSAQVYVVALSDTMSKIAAKFGITLEALCAANKDTITNCDKIAIGDEITIPAKPQDQFTEPSPGPS